MRDQGRSKHSFVIGEEPLAPATITDQQFAVNEFMADDLIEAKKPIKFLRERLATCERPDPHRGVNQDHCALWLPVPRDAAERPAHPARSR